MWSVDIIRKHIRKSHFPFDASGKLSKVCQLLDPERAIVTLKTSYTTNKCLPQMRRAKAAFGLLLSSDFLLTDHAYLEHCI